MAAPTTGDPVQVRIPPEDIDLIDAFAEAENVSRSEMLRVLVREALSNRARRAKRRATA